MPLRSAQRGCRKPVTTNATSAERRQRPELGRGHVHQVGDAPPGVREGIGQPAVELGAEGDVPEARPGARIGVDERRPQPAGAKDHLEADQHRRDREGRDARRDEPAAAEDARLDGEDEEQDRRAEQQRQRVVADRQPGHDRGGDQEPVRRPGVRRRPDVRVDRAAAPGLLPADQQPEDDREQGEMEGVRIGVGPDGPDDRRQRDPDPGGDAEGDRAAQATGEIDREGRPDRDEDRREDVHPQGGLAERLEERPTRASPTRT